jgi:glycogen debranching enzyme
MAKMQSLARMARILGLLDEARDWHHRATVLVEKMVANLWDEKHGYFLALHAGKPVPVLTPFNLLPLWTGQLPSDIQKRLIGHLTNEYEFWGKVALPTVAYNDPRFSADVMWRGPAWANINYFFIEALTRIGEKQLACELRQKTLEMIMNCNGIYEYYNTASGAPGAKAAPIFGWTAAVFIDLAIQASRD